MKRIILLSALLCGSLIVFSQTQQGLVKTKGRMDSQGNLIPGQGLKGATVSVQGRSAVLVNKDDGAFSFPVTEAQFRLDSVKKKGYQLVDLDACPRTYKYSGNPLYIVMETPDQQLQDQLAAERKIRRNLQKQLQDREDEIEDLKAQQKISDEEYRQALQKLYQDQESNEQLIKDMAKRYSELDYDQLDEFYRQVSYCIENGQLTKADSLLKTRGDITAQVGDIIQRGQSLQEERSQLEKAEAVQQADIDEAARRCYGYYETFAAQHLNDTAAYFLELRASLDTTNVDWQLKCGLFLKDYLADYTKALRYFQLALRQSLSQNGNNDIETAKCYGNTGNLYYRKGDYSQALGFHGKALSIREEILCENHVDFSKSYNNIGIVYYKMEVFDKALEYHQKALDIKQKCSEKNDASIALSLSNIGLVYYSQKNFETAKDFFERALNMRLSVFGEMDRAVGSSYNNLGLVYSSCKEYAQAIEYYNKALAIRKSVLGANHPDVAQTYYVIGNIYNETGDYQTALYYYHQAMAICQKVFDPNHNTILILEKVISEVQVKLKE